MEWSHTLLGQYSIEADSLAVDLARNFMDPAQAELVHVHEATHAAISRTTDLGLASIPIHANIEKFVHLSKREQLELMAVLHEPQLLPQEGFASLMEILHLAGRIGKSKALEYAKEKFPPEYYSRLEELSYCLKMSHGHREYFTKGVSWLAMETGFRQAVPRNDLLRSPTILKKYFDDQSHNPTYRLRAVNNLLLSKPWMVTKHPKEIAKASRITYFEPASKQVVADYMNYIAELAGAKPIYTATMINDSDGLAAIKDAFENARVTNINHNFSEDAEFLTSLEDIEWEANTCDLAMVMSWPVYEERERILEEATGMKPEFSLVFFRRTGEKYIAFVTKEKATELVDGKLNNKTIMTRDDLYVIDTGEFILSKTRMPDIIYYDHPKTLQYRFNEADKSILKSESLSMGTTKDHPYRIVAFRLNEQRPLHMANSFGDKVTVDIQTKLGSRNKTIDMEILRSEYIDVVNDYFGTMGLNWEIDWVTAMIDKKELGLRK